jgi:hypothetical protein
VSGALRSNPHPPRAGKPQRLLHITGRFRLHHDRGPLINGEIPHPPRLVIAGLA